MYVLHTFLLKMYRLKGKVVSENEAVEFANVVLQTKDSIFIAGGSNRQ